MKIIIYLAMCFITHGVMAQYKDVTPLSIVNARMDAYNSHDLGAFLKNYSKDIQVFTYLMFLWEIKGRSI